MAAPTYRAGTAPVAGGSTTSPAGTAIGDLVVIYTFERLGAGTATTLTTDTGNNYVEIRNHFHNDGSTDGSLAVAYKIATAGGAQAYTAFTSSTGVPVWWTGCFVVQTGTYSVATLPPSDGISQTNNALPNPPAVTGLSASRDYLVAAIAAWHISSATVTPTAPSGYGNLLHIAGAATAELASATLGVTGVTSEDPGTFGDDVAPSGSAIITLAISNPLTPTKGRVSWAEAEAPFKATRGRVSWAEAETPFKATRGRISWAEVETPLVPTKGRISWAEAETPDLDESTPTRGLVSWAELEAPEPPTPTRGLVSWAEMETPFVATRGRISWAEFSPPSEGGPDNSRRRSRYCFRFSYRSQ
jgi:hypothetical protein